MIKNAQLCNMRKTLHMLHILYISCDYTSKIDQPSA